MSSSLLLQQCPACLVRLTLMVFVMGGRRPYSCCFVGCCLQDLFKLNMIYCIILYNFIFAQSAGAVEYTAPLQRGKTPHLTSVLDMTLNNLMELWGMRSTPSLPSLPGPLWLGVVAPDRALSMG